MTHQWVSNKSARFAHNTKTSISIIVPSDDLALLRVPCPFLTMKVFTLDTPLFWATFWTESLSVLLPSLKRTQ